MSNLLWTAFFDNDIQTFLALLETPTPTGRKLSLKGIHPGSIRVDNRLNSPVAAATSPLGDTRDRKVSARLSSTTVLTRADVNRKDRDGLTLLHHVASRTTEDALPFAYALIDSPLIDFYIQDSENGWTVLHRALYFGNLVVALVIYNKDADTSADHLVASRTHTQPGLFRVKDRDGLGPFDLYATTVGLTSDSHSSLSANVPKPSAGRDVDSDTDDDDTLDDADMDAEDDTPRVQRIDIKTVDGDEFFTFGSNRNASLGFADTDDRQRPEKIMLRRPDHLIQRFHQEYLARRDRQAERQAFLDHTDPNVPSETLLSSIPWQIRARPIVVQDICMSKLHTAVLTTDPEANLYMCGHGQSGRLGLGHVKTQYQLTCVQGGSLAGEKIASVALGLNHTLAISAAGEIFSWGANHFGQLGYALPKTTPRDEDPFQSLPRQIFGSLKRETILGIAASSIHSVAHTSSSLYVWGKNEGQLGIVDSDARSLECQLTPRKVAPSQLTSPIKSVCVNDRATVCLLESAECWVFANYGYLFLQLSHSPFANLALQPSQVTTDYSGIANRITKIVSGGDTICAMTGGGQVYGWSVNRAQGKQADKASTTNPAKIKSALSPSQCMWFPRQVNMDAKDVAVDVDGSITITTKEGSVWRRFRRAKLHDMTASSNPPHRAKDYKVTKVAGLTKVEAVRSSAYGSYAAIRRDCGATKTQMQVEPPSLWRNLMPLLHLNDLASFESAQPTLRFWRAKPHAKPSRLQSLKQQLLESSEVEEQLVTLMQSSMQTTKYDAMICTSLSDTRIPAHRFLLTGRSSVLRKSYHLLRLGKAFSIPGLLSACIDGHDRFAITLEGADLLTMINIALYCYTDEIVDYWNHTTRAPSSANRYRQVRNELIKVASALKMTSLEVSVRQMSSPLRTLHTDLDSALQDSMFFEHADAIVQLADDQVAVHSALVSARSPFFNALFNGADGRWVESRRAKCPVIAVDLSHIPSNVFCLVRRHLYADTEEELSDDIVASSEDIFVDLVIQVMGVADELMIDRLSQVCQKVIGKYGMSFGMPSLLPSLTQVVNIRNVCFLTTSIAPYAVTEFKDASLAYMCFNLEALIHARAFDELPDNLLLELQATVRHRQRERMHFSRNPCIEQDLMRKNPELDHLMAQNKRAKIKELDVSGHRFETDERRISARQPGSHMSPGAISPAVIEARKPSSDSISDSSFNANLLGQPSTQAGTSLERFSIGSPAFDAASKLVANLTGHEHAQNASASTPDAGMATAKVENKPLNVADASLSRTQVSQPWLSVGNSSPVSKLDLKDIMTQTSLSRISNLSLGIAAGQRAENQPRSRDVPIAKGAKVSQKDRKRMQQQQRSPQDNSSGDSNALPLTTPSKQSQALSPWQTPPTQKVASLKDLISSEERDIASKGAVAGSSSPRPLTMRQTIAKQRTETPIHSHIRPEIAISEGSQSVLMSRTAPIMKSASPKAATPSAGASIIKLSSPASRTNDSATVSSQYSPGSAEDTLQLSIADIVTQQQLEKDVIRDAGAKRSLQEIQEEQSFQAWWDKEEQRYKDLDAARSEVHGGTRTLGQSSRGGTRGGKRRSSARDLGEGGSSSLAGKIASSRRKSHGGGDKSRQMAKSMNSSL